MVNPARVRVNRVRWGATTDIVEATFDGRIDYGDLLDAGRAAAQIAAGQKIQNFLCCADEISPTSPVGVLLFVKAFARQWLGKGNRMAILLPVSISDGHDAATVKGVAAQWGFRVARFTSRATAVAWLESHSCDDARADAV